MRWAARYTFCDPLWRGRARLIVDPELEAVLRHALVERRGADAPWRELLDALVPRERGVPVWMLVGTDDTARLLAPHWPGVRFVAMDAIEDRVARAPWEIALVTFVRGEHERPLGVAADDGDDARRFAGPTRDLLDDVAAAMGRGRMAVVTAVDDDLAYDEFAALLRPRLPDAKIYAGYAPGMFAFVEFDAESDDDDDDLDDDEAPTQTRAPQWDDDDDDLDALAEEPVPLSFDNTLGPGDPALTVWLGIVGNAAELAEGLTLVELPEDDVVEPAGVVAGLRRQLHETRRAAELAGLERQRQVERIDALEADNAALREALAQVREQLAGALDPSGAAERMDAVLAREQSLRWRVAGLERELSQLRVRPVDELTAELEHLRAVAGAAATATSDEDAASTGAMARESSAPRPAASAPAPVGATDEELPHRIPPPDAARRIARYRGASGRAAALQAVESLLRRFELGAIERTALRRELAGLRRRLRG